MGGILRIAWMWALPAAFVSILLIGVQPAWTLGEIDAALVLVVLCGSLARLADVESYGGTTAEGDPATRKDAIRYASSLVAATTLGWLLAQSVDL